MLRFEVAKETPMVTGIYLLVALLALFVVVYGAFRLSRGVRAYLKFRGKRLVTCPETQRPAAVEVDSKHTALEAVVGEPHLRLSECSRWPERQDCGQQCLKQIELAPEDCLVKTIMTQWYVGKTCAYCGKVIHEVEWLGHKPGLMNPEHKTVYWDAVTAEKLPEVFSTHAPVCWDCHIAQTLRREHPDLIVDRPWRR